MLISEVLQEKQIRLKKVCVCVGGGGGGGGRGGRGGQRGGERK